MSLPNQPIVFDDGDHDNSAPRSDGHDPFASTASPWSAVAVLLSPLAGYVLFIAKSAWGAGIATEMADAVLRYGFLDLKLPRIAGMTSLQNRASQHVLLKIGLEQRGERAFAHPDYAAEGPMAWFERDREDWRAEHDS